MILQFSILTFLLLHYIIAFNLVSHSAWPGRGYRVALKGSSKGYTIRDPFIGSILGFYNTNRFFFHGLCFSGPSQGASSPLLL